MICSKLIAEVLKKLVRKDTAFLEEDRAKRCGNSKGEDVLRCKLIN